MVSGISVRPIADGDWDRIVALEASAYADSGLSEEREVLKSRAVASPATCFVLRVGQRIAGYLLSLPYPLYRCPDLSRAEQHASSSHNLHLHDLVIDKDFRGGGLGRHLLRHLTAVAKADMYQRISLVAVAGSGTFWSANGFRSYPRLVLPETYGADALYMSKVIDQQPMTTT